MFFDMMDVPRIRQGSYVSISKESKRTLEVPERSLGGF